METQDRTEPEADRQKVGTVVSNRSDRGRRMEMDGGRAASVSQHGMGGTQRERHKQTPAICKRCREMKKPDVEI